MPDTPRVWLACLAAYNNGQLHGKWVDATDADELREAAAEVLRTSPVPGAEEIAIHDYDGFGAALTFNLGEYPNFELVATLGQLIEEYGAEFHAYCSAADVAYDLRENADRIREDFEDRRRGQWDNKEDYAYELVREIGWSNVPASLPIGRFGDGAINVFEELSGVIDWEKIARDLFDHGLLAYIDGYVFDMDA